MSDEQDEKVSGDPVVDPDPSAADLSTDQPTDDVPVGEPSPGDVTPAASDAPAGDDTPPAAAAEQRS